MENMQKDYALLQKLGLTNPDEIKYTWELVSDSQSFDQQMKNLDVHIRKYTFRDDSGGKAPQVQSQPVNHGGRGGGLFGPSAPARGASLFTNSAAARGGGSFAPVRGGGVLFGSSSSGVKGGVATGNL